MIFILSMIFGFLFYLAIGMAHLKEKTVYVYILAAIATTTITIMGMYIEKQNEEINKLESPCPEYEEIQGVYKLRQ